MPLFQFHSLSLNLFYHFAAPQLHTGLILLTFHCCDIGLDWHPVKKLYVGSCCLYTIRLLWTHLFPKTVYIFLSFLPFTSNFPGVFFFFFLLLLSFSCYFHFSLLQSSSTFLKGQQLFLPRNDLPGCSETPTLATAAALTSLSQFCTAADAHVIILFSEVTGLLQHPPTLLVLWT